MKCARCGRYPDPNTGGRGWYALTDKINYCPDCKPRSSPPERDIRGMSDEQYWDAMADARSY